MKLTPSKLVMARQKLVPIAEKHEVNLTELLNKFLDNFKMFNELLTIDEIITAMGQELDGVEEEEEIEQEIIKTEPVKPSPKQMDLTGKEAKKVDVMKNTFWDKVEIDSGEFAPWFKVMNGIRYELALADPSAEPRPHKDKNFNRDQWIWDIKLIDLDKKEAYSEVDDKGNSIYVKGRIYSFAMGKRAMGRFREFYLEHSTNGSSLEIPFKMKRTGQKFQTDYAFTV